MLLKQARLKARSTFFLCIWGRGGLDISPQGKHQYVPTTTVPNNLLECTQSLRWCLDPVNGMLELV